MVTMTSSRLTQPPLATTTSPCGSLEPDSKGEIKKQCIAISHNAFLTDKKPPHHRKKHSGPRIYIAHLYLQKPSFTRRPHVAESSKCLVNVDVMHESCDTLTFDDIDSDSDNSQSNDRDTSMTNPVIDEEDGVKKIFRRFQSFSQDEGFQRYTHLLLRRHHGCYSAGASSRYQMNS